MGPDCTDIFLEQLPHVGFRFCFTSAVMSPGCPGGLGSFCWPAPRAVGGGGGAAARVAEGGHPLWIPCSVRKTNQVITLTSLPRGRRKLPFREPPELFALGLQILSFNSSTVYSS